MKKKFLSILLALAACLALLPTMAMAAGDGYTDDGFCTAWEWKNGVLEQSATCSHTSCNGYEPAVLNGDVYQIGNAGQLYWFAAKVNSGSTTINAKLTADITINTNMLYDSGSLKGDGSKFRQWTPIGNDSNEYTGTFDGDGKFISGLCYNSGSDQYVGLFGIISTKGTVKNVTLKDSYLYSNRAGNIFVGGIAGSNTGKVEGCTVSATVRGKNSGNESFSYVGGVVGCNVGGGRVTGCTNSGSVSNTYTDSNDNAYAGGIAGYSYGTTIEKCVNSGKVKGWKYAGGIVGSTSGCVSDCGNTGAVDGAAARSEYVGGVAGYIRQTTIKNCYSTGTVAPSSAAAVVGTVGTGTTFTNCYYLAGSGTNNYDDGATCKTADNFASGEVTWLLNGKRSTGELVWYQTLPTSETDTSADSYPTLDSTRGTVYGGYTDSCTPTFSNTSGEGLSPDPTHSWANGVCTVCSTECGHKNVDADDKCTVCTMQMVVCAEKAGSDQKDYFTSLNTALKSENGYTKFTLLTNCDEEAKSSYSGQSFALDLNGHSLKALETKGGDSSLTVTDSVGNGSIGTLTLQGSATLSGGSYGTINTTCALEDALAAGYAYRYNTTENTGMVELSGLSGGTLEHVKVVKCTSHGAVTDDNKCGYCNTAMVAKVTYTESGAEQERGRYATFNEAYTAAQSGDTLTLLENATYEYTVNTNDAIASKTEMSRNITLTIDLGGHTLTARDTQDACWYIYQGNHTLKNGTVKTNMLLVEYNGSLTLADNVSVDFLYLDGGTLNITGENVQVGTLSLYTAKELSLTKGTFRSITTMFGKVCSLLADGYGFKTTGDEPVWYDSSSTATEITNVTVMQLPITSVSITTTDSKTSYPYGDTVNLSATVTPRDEAYTGEIEFEWYLDDAPGDDTFVYDGKTTVTTNAENLNVGSHTFRVEVTISGYTVKSSDLTVEVTQATPSYTAPTANTLTYNGTNQGLVNVGAITTGCTMWYKLDNGNWIDTAPKAKNAGTYTVSWYIDGGTNYQNVGSRENPADTLIVTIGPKTVGRSDITVTVNETPTYDGTAKTPAVTVTVETDTADEGGLTSSTASVPETLNAEDYTVAYENNINAGDLAKVTVTARQGGNYTWTDPVAANFSIAQAAAPSSLISLTAYRTAGSTEPQTVSVASVGMPADAGALGYSVTPNSKYSASIDSDGLLTISSVTGDADARVNIAVRISSANYRTANFAVTVILTEKAMPTVSAQDITATYNGSALDSSLIRGTATYNNETVAGSWSWSAAAPKNVSDSGEVSVTFTPNDTNTYAPVTTNLNVTVAPRRVTVGPKSYTITQGDAIPTFELEWSGVLEGDTLGLSIAEADLSCYAGMTEVNTSTAAGSYNINWLNAESADLTGVNAANYELNKLATGTLTINARSTGDGGSIGGGGSSAGTTVTVPVSSDHASVEVKAEVSKGNATVEVSDRQVEQVIADHAGEVTIDVSGLKNVESATVPSHVVEKTNEAENTGLTVALPAGSVTLDETALGSVTENANGKDVTVSVVSVPTTKLPTAVKEIIGMEPTVVAVVDVNVTVNGVKQSSFDGGKVTVSIPYTPKAGEDTSKLTVWFIKDDGTIENKGGWYDAKSGCFVFETEHLSQYLLVNTNELASFTDVPADAWYAPAVNWAVGKSITGGIGEGKFGPDLSCTRAQLVTFLYRAAVAQGVDTSVGADTNILSYTDALEIPEYAVEAFQWAVGVGIVQGYDGALMPNDDCTRAQIVTMLYRFAVTAGKDVSVGEDTNILSYTDAPEVPEYAAAPFQWATGAGIIQGAGGKLMPGDTCTRSQIVTMLYRLLSK